ncbi:MAG: cell division protein FtsL [Steroidobacteraceae bacterium]
MTKSSGTILDDAKRRPAGLGPRMGPSKPGTATLGVAIVALWAAVLLSAAGAVYCKFRARQLFIQLEQLSTQRDDLDIQWGQLQLEQSAWSTHAFIESVAGKKLHMAMPAPKDIVVVYP